MSELLPADNDRRVALVDLLDRVLAGGVVISGDITLSIADVDMVVISLRTLISSIGSLSPDLLAADEDGASADDRTSL